LTGIAYPGGGTNTFVYNGLDQRVGKTHSAGTFTYTLDGDSVDADVLRDGAAVYNHGLGLVSEVGGGTSKFYHADALGTTRAISDGGQSTSDTT
jgi:YD repeat-containing protein